MNTKPGIIGKKLGMTQLYKEDGTVQRVTVVDTKTLGVLKTIDLGKGMRPMGTASSPDGRFMFVTTGRSRMLTIIDTTSETVVGSIDVGQRPWGLAVSSDGQTVYTANGPSDDVSIVDVTGRRVVTTVPVGRGPWGAILVDRR